MSWVLHLTQMLLGGALCLLGAYLAVLTVGAWRYRGPPQPAATTGTLRVVVLIPAHDEGAGVVPTIEDLKANAYPTDAFEIVVIADNCSDDTAEQARRAGATVLERRDPALRGKAHALDWALRTHGEHLGAFDLISLVDADMHVDRAYLRATADAFSDPSVRVVQGRYTMDNATDSFYAAMGFVSYAYVNHVRPAGRCAWGGTADLKGSGMTFRSDLLLERGWPSKSLAEDVHFGKLLYLDGIRIRYVPDAIVTSAIPPSRSQVSVQQQRWEAGRSETFREVFLPTLRATLRHPDPGHLDAMLDLLTPPLSVVAAAIAGSAALALTGYGSLVPAAVGLIGFGGAVATGLVQLRAPMRVYGQLLRAPVFVVWKLLLLLRLRLLGGPGGWNRTPRQAPDSRES